MFIAVGSTIHTINDIKKGYMFIAVGSTINTINDIVCIVFLQQ
jgi:hypothetical protein